jgi:arylsulfatase A-like enzyme
MLVLLKYFSFVVCALLALIAAPCQADKRPNIILITIDTFRADRIGYYGNPRDTSPQLDQFAREGVFFRQAFSSSGWTTPGLISILTSLYAPTHAVDIRGRRLDPEVETLPDVLRRAGYRAPDIFFLSEIPNFANLGLEPYALRQQLLPQGDEILFHWLRDEGKGDDPFFLYYHYRDLHLPYSPGEGYEELYLDEAFASPLSLLSAFKRFIAHEKMGVIKKNVVLSRGDMDFAARDSSWVRALYDAEIRRMDDQLFAGLRRTLNETGLAENTIVVVSADHGEELLDRGLVGHISTFKEGRLYDEITRIPLVLWMPGTLPAGRVVEDPVQCIDIMPTLLEMAGVAVPASAQGRSLLPVINKDPNWESKPLFFESSAAGYGANPEEYDRRFRAVRTAGWKLIHDVAEERYELYDLRRDPQELDDIWGQNTARADSLGTMLNEWALYAHKSAYRSEGGGDTPAENNYDNRDDGPPIIGFPSDGDTLHYQGEEHEIRLSWSGPAQTTYAIEYEVGLGTYHLAGEITEASNNPVYGPFQAGFWNSLVMYNPWKFRVYRPGHPDEKSEWVRFYLAPSQGGEEPEWTLASLLHGVVIAYGEMGNLLVGLSMGVGDLYWFLAAVPASDLSAYTLLIVLLGAVGQPLYLRWGPERLRVWAGALVYTVFVYSTIPLLPEVWATLREYTQGAISHLGGVIIAVGALAMIVRLVRKMRGEIWRYFGLVFVAIAYAYLLGEFARFPAERLHLVEYGFMGYMIFRALRMDVGPASAYLGAWAIAVLIGVGDECIQWVLPQRFFEVKDIQLNAVSAALGLVVVYIAQEASKKDGDGI